MEAAGGRAAGEWAAGWCLASRDGGWRRRRSGRHRSRSQRQFLLPSCVLLPLTRLSPPPPPMPKSPPVGGHSLHCRPLTETTVVASAVIARSWRVVVAATTAGNKRHQHLHRLKDEGRE